MPKKTSTSTLPLNSSIKRAYATDEMLSIRQHIHEHYTVPHVNFVDWILDRVEWAGDEIVLDLGCGSGRAFDAIRQRIPNGALAAMDISAGMTVKAARQYPDVPIINADALALPFADHSFDIVLATHMLYHVSDVAQALSEIHRVLKPMGCLITSTDSKFNLPEFDQLIRRAYGLLKLMPSDTDMLLNKISRTFNLENAPQILAREFFAVARYDLPSAFVFTSPQPAIEYIASLHDLCEPYLHKHLNWEDFLNILEDQFQRLINHFGELVISKLNGVIVATDKGKFATQYVIRLNQSSNENSEQG